MWKRQFQLKIRANHFNLIEGPTGSVYLEMDSENSAVASGEIFVIFEFFLWNGFKIPGTWNKVFYDGMNHGCF